MNIVPAVAATFSQPRTKKFSQLCTKYTCTCHQLNSIPSESQLPCRRHARARECDVGPGARHHVRGRRRFGGFGHRSLSVGAAEGGDVVAVLIGVEMVAAV